MQSSTLKWCFAMQEDFTVYEYLVLEYPLPAAEGVVEKEKRNIPNLSSKYVSPVVHVPCFHKCHFLSKWDE